MTPAPDGSITAALPADAPARLARLVAAFRGPIDRPRSSPLSRAGLGGVAVAMVLLPLLYVALALAAAWGVITLDRALLDSGVTGRNLLLGLLAVTVGGGTVVVFMFKPL